MPTTIPVSDETKALVEVLSQESGLSDEEIAETAVRTLHRSWVGHAPQPPAPSLPFKKRFSDFNADATLRQEGATEFHLVEAFRYRRPGADELIIREGNVTDLASVPSFLTWLVPRYGRHTLPALMHDQLVVGGMAPDERERADHLFRDAMGETRVPFLRRWVMWAGVSMATMLTRGWKGKVATLAWLLAYALAGLHLLAALISLGTVWHVPFLSLRYSALSVPSALVLSLLWGRRYRFGLISAWALLLLPASVIGIGITLGLYVLAEGLTLGGLHVYRWFARKPVVINPVRLSKLPEIAARRAASSANT